MSLKVKVKSFAEIASVSVPELQYTEDRGNYIVLRHLGYRNFNTPEGKYTYDPYFMLPLAGKEITVDPDQYEHGFLYETEDVSIKFGKWMLER